VGPTFKGREESEREKGAREGWNPLHYKFLATPMMPEN